MPNQRKAMCIWCGHEAHYAEGDELGRARAWKELVAHDGACPKNPTALERDRFREALKKYGKHLPNCLGGLSGRTECTCGLLAALNQPKEG